MNLTRSEFNSEPHGHWHNAVMNNVKCGYLIVLLPQYEEQSVEELGEFAYVVPPATLGHSHCFGVSRIINWLTPVRVVVPPACHQTLQQLQKNKIRYFLFIYLF